MILLSSWFDEDSRSASPGAGSMDFSRFLPLISSASLSEGEEPVRAYRWLFEAWLVRARWVALPLCLLAIPLFSFSAAHWPVLVLLALGLGLGNAWVAWLLGCSPHTRRLREARWWGTGVDWLLALVALGLSAGTSAHATLPALLLLLVLATGLRFGRTGLLGAGLGAALLVAFLVALHSFVLRVLILWDAIFVMAGWELLIALTMLLTGGILQARGDWFRWEQDHQASQDATARRLEYKLSAREWELLRWLAREDLTYEQIASELCISPATVRVHTRHIGEKLGVAGRRRVVLAARKCRLLPIDQDPPL